MVLAPASLDVVVGSNLFADILSDLGGAIQGGLGTAASANIAPGANVPGIFEPAHGSATDIAGRGIANPTGAVWSAALMLEYLGQAEGAEKVMQALQEVFVSGPRTPDVGGGATTREVEDALVEAIARD